MTLRHFFASLALLSLSFSASAAKLVPDLRHLDDLPMHSLPLQLMQKSVADAVRKNKPLQFAVSASLPLSLSDGVWQQQSDGSWSWRTRVFSSGAQTLNFEFSRFHLPADAELWVYDVTGKRVDGPYTKANETADGKLWTAVVLGDTAVLEARVSAATKDQVDLQLSKVNHGYRGFEAASSSLGTFGSSSSCETNVACPAGASWTNESRAVARIQIGGQFLCTGQLVNNVNQDDTPYFLTAYHCEIGQTSGTPASSLIVYWNYQFSQCTSTSTEPNYQTQSGSTLIAGNPTADFTLVKLTQTPPAAANVYFSGWDASSTDVPQSGVVIHHPQGDVKKISTYSASPTRVPATLTLDDGSTRTVQGWKVFYSQGITEQGSSGSGLLNESHQLVGQLSGGNTACSLLGTSNNSYDIYGRLDYGWTATSAANGQLKASLDPNGTGQLTLPGKNPSSSSSSGTGSSTGSGSTTTSTSTSTTTTSSSGGGGALPPLTLAGLAGLLALRRRKFKSGFPPSRK